MRFAEITLISTIFVLFPYSDACAPVPSSISSTQRLSSSSALSSQRSFGQSTLQSSPLDIGGDNPPLAPISDVADLSCIAFDEKCRWRNIEGPLMDELDWYQGSGFLDAMRLQFATGTHMPPDAPYAIVATDRVQMPTAKAVLVSDPIPCQMGPGELRFKYWTSPKVKVTVCTKQISKIYPDFDYCSPTIEIDDPGPAVVAIPDLDRQAFQIFIRAENFVYESANLQGGFAIIDDLGYYSDLCSDLPFPLAADAPPPQPSARAESSVDLGLPITRRPSSSPSTSLKPMSPAIARACQVLDCTFSVDDYCSSFVSNTDWAIANGPVGGIGGDASRLPFNPVGSYAYIAGPNPMARFVTGPFALDQAVNFLFAYFKTGSTDLFRVMVKRRDRENELVLFQAPRTFGDSRRWFRELRSLQPGEYEYLSFDVSNLSANNIVGVDQFTLLDSEQQKPLC